MFDPTQTQPLSWRMHQGKATPVGEVPIDPSNRQDPTIDSGPPERLSERGYRLRERIGHGRLGPIYQAQDELSRISGSQHFAAIQLIDPKIAAQPGFEADFERGAAELKSISHPNIVKLLEYGRERNHFYLVNELLESASLRSVLNDVNALPLEEAVAVMRAVGDALQYLHAKSIVHGNLRPENVLVTFGYDVKLLDIVPTGWLANPNDALGVPARAPDKRDDVFGLACLTYEMLSGRHPFNGNSAQEAYRAGLEPERLDDLTASQWRALDQALAVHRDDRTPNVQQFLDGFGVSNIQKLRTVIAAGQEARTEPRVPPAAPMPSMPTMPSRVVAERSAPYGRPRRGIFGSLFLLAALVVAGAAAWIYREPLRTFTTELAARVDSEMKRDQPTADTAATTPDAAEEPLARAPAITDDTPATVLAPGTRAPEPARPALPEIAQPEPETPTTSTPPASSTESETVATPPAAVARQEPEPAPVESPPVTVARQEPEPSPVESTAVAPPPAASSGPTHFGFQQPIVTVREGDVAARIQIRRSGNLSGAAEVSWWTSQGTAIADSDYADLGARVERFAPGEASRTIFVPLTNDSVAEPGKSFSVLLGRGNDPASEIRVDIVDDD